MLYYKKAIALISEKGKKMPLFIYHIDLNFRNLREEEIKRRLRAASELGCNAVLWEPENKVVWDSCPECAEPEAMSKETFAGLVAYGRSLGLEPIPLLQTLGHAEYVLLQRPYHDLRELPDSYDCYCPSHPGVRRLLRAWIDEYCELFGPIRYFHLGGDEAYFFHRCPACAARPPLELYNEYFNELATGLRERGIRPSVWGDMLWKYAGSIDELDRDFVIWDWNYRDGCGNPDRILWIDGKEYTVDTVNRSEADALCPGLIESDGKFRSFFSAEFFRNHGFEVILCGTAASAIDGFFFPHQLRHADNLVGAARAVRQRGYAGCCITNWSIRLVSAPWTMAAAQASALAFHGDARPVEALLDEASCQLFGDPGIWRTLDRLAVAGNSRWRLFTAIQHTGFKDQLPAPPDAFERQLRVPDCPRLSAEPAESANCAAVLKAQFGSARIVEGAALQRDFLELLAQRLQGIIPDTESFRQKLLEYWDAEEKPRNARLNAFLMLQLIDNRYDLPHAI